ncbi:putative cytochrome P450 52A12 [Coleophoma cylindrospora]|uniref:Putative cytochrome P450 52A12 n=1 Tax=Coleophoma cylindrospora TaxID=1849047 RepID=A0A3D8RMK8_9HELO|nr:putative cytochrome P450 52A12 [Coleophoma cylindrospora]
MEWSYYLYAGALVLAFFVALKISDFIAVARFQKKHGCKPARPIPQRERVIGYDLYKAQVKAHKEKRLLDLSRKRFADYGNTWSATMMGRTFINTTEPENIKAILATNFKDFGIGKRINAFGPLLGQGIFTSDGALWEHSRALVRPNFTRTQVADLTTFETHIQHLFARVPRDGGVVDIQNLFFQLTMDSASEFLLGVSVNSLSSPEGSESNKFAASFDFAQSRLGNRSRLGMLVHIFRDAEFDKACKIVHEYVDGIVDGALERAKALDLEKNIDGKERAERYIFLDELVKATRNPKQIRDELLNVFLAGRDTTASLLSHSFHVLARRQDIWKKLKAEVDELNGAKPTYETLRNMKYLKNFLNEALRLYPIVPGNGRFANKATVLPTGGGPQGKDPLFVAKDQVVAYSVYTMHRMPSIYGPDADEFKPERWDSPSLRPGWGYLPFNGGPRICVGQQFALTEASYTIVRILQEFGDIIPRDDNPWREQLSLTLSVADGVKVTLVPREK